MAAATKPRANEELTLSPIEPVVNVLKLARNRDTRGELNVSRVGYDKSLRDRSKLTRGNR